MAGNGTYIDILDELENLFLRSTSFVAHLDAAGVGANETDRKARIIFNQYEDDNAQLDMSSLTKPAVVLDIMANYQQISEACLYPATTVSMTIIDDVANPGDGEKTETSFRTFATFVGKFLDEIGDRANWTEPTPHIHQINQTGKFRRTATRERNEDYDFWRVDFNFEIGQDR